MANKTIVQLPEQTGVTDNDVLAIVDSGETTTSKIKVSTLLSGISGGGDLVGTTGDTLTNANGLGPADNIISGTTDFVNFGFNNYVANGSVNIGYDNTQLIGFGSGGVSIGRGNINGFTDYVSVGINNSHSCCGRTSMIFGKNNTDSSGVTLGKNNTSTNSNNPSSTIVGNSNTSNAQLVSIVGTSNNASAQGVVMGYSNTAGADGIIFGGNNTTSNGGYPSSANIVMGNSNTISAGNTQTIIGNDHTISSTGLYNSIFGGKSNEITGTTSGTTIIGLQSFTATKDDMVYLPALTLVDYASYNFADDSAAATGGISLGGIYHNAGALRVRIT